MVNLKLWDAVTQSLVGLNGGDRNAGHGTGGPGQSTLPLVKVQKLPSENDLEAFPNTFERTTTAAGWAHDQWTVVLISCLIGPAQPSKP